MWLYRCKKCEDLLGEKVLHMLDPLEDFPLIIQNKCRRCRQTDALEPVDQEDESKDVVAYKYWDVCNACRKWRLVSSGTGCCYDCDGRPDLDEIRILISREREVEEAKNGSSEADLVNAAIERLGSGSE